MAHQEDWVYVRRQGYVQARSYVPGEDLTGIYVDTRDVPEEGGWILRDPWKPGNSWYVNPQNFSKLYKY